MKSKAVKNFNRNNRNAIITLALLSLAGCSELPNNPADAPFPSLRDHGEETEMIDPFALQPYEIETCEKNGVIKPFHGPTTLCI